MSDWVSHVRLRLLTGLLFLIPLAVCLWLVNLIFGIIDGVVSGQVRQLLEEHGDLGFTTVWVARGIAVVLLLMLFYVVGLLATNVFGSRLLKVFELGVERIPVVGGIYRGTRQMTEALGAGRGAAFRRCVLVEYPRVGVWTLGFVTNERQLIVGDPPRPHVAVFVPTTPNPTAGFFLLVAQEQCRPTSISLEEGFKVIVSAGIVIPDGLVPAPAGLNAGPQRDRGPVQ